ncbi:MAG: glutamate-5-semialdehyde dehydrogenase [Candidatus Ratteibacteria bacterium]|nr:glutamate-5-semialdehyde dehydrogenase [Candidatus Ratteibacteria bacterium]
MEKTIKGIAEGTKRASYILSQTATELKNKALRRMAALLERNAKLIIAANQKDIRYAKAKKLPPALIDRLALNDKRIKAMAGGLNEVAALKDPVGEIIKKWKRPNGLEITKIRVPIGVIGIIYESRPNVTADVAGLCLKSGNGVILRGGSEAIHSNQAIVNILSQALSEVKLPEAILGFIGFTRHEAVKTLLKMDKFIDLIIPRGGEQLIRTVTENSRIPVIKHDKGVCHTYVDREADLNQAETISYNAKMNRPGTCNAMETLLVHRDIAGVFLPRMLKRFKEARVKIRGCVETQNIFPAAQKASEEDWSAEYLDLILAVKVVGGLKEAVAHINKYGSKHSEAIITENRKTAQLFLDGIDAACLYVNASTRFTDGNQFGMGAEIGISTSKIHARGPMALEELTSYKYLIRGSGQIRE